MGRKSESLLNFAIGMEDFMSSINEVSIDRKDGGETPSNGEVAACIAGARGMAAAFAAVCMMSPGKRPSSELLLKSIMRTWLDEEFSDGKDGDAE